MDFVVEPKRETPITARKDVVVVGGGPTGVMASVAAARAGANVMLIESNAFFGGVATMGLPIQGYYDRQRRPIVRGLGQELVERLRKRGGAYSEFIDCKLHNPYLIIDPEIVKIVCQEMIEEAGVEPLLHSHFAEVAKEGDEIRAVMLETKSGREAVSGQIYIDATGDGDVAARSGASFGFGRESDGLPQSVTLEFRIDGVDTMVLTRLILENPQRYDLYKIPREQFRTNRKHILVGLSNLVEEARRDGMQGLDFGQVCYITLIPEGAISINMTHVVLRSLDSREMTRAEMESREQVFKILDFLKRYVPGFENARLTSTAHQIGVRETRHILGEYTLELEDVQQGKFPNDTIAVGGYPIDIHSPTAEDVVVDSVPAYGIPLRCLLPKGILNLLVAGRCISGTHEAMGTARQMSTCMAMGQAAGVAATIAALAKQSIRDVDIEELRRRLIDQGAYLGEDPS
jgi:hypothetical protein